MKIAPFDRMHKFLLAFHINNVTILHCFWDIARYWLKINYLNLSHLCLAPLGWLRQNFTVILASENWAIVALFAWS